MSNDRMFDHYSQSLLDISMRRGEDIDDAEWEAQVRRYLRFIYRQGTSAGLSHRYGEIEESVDRVRWLVEHDFATADVVALLSKVEQAQEKEAAFQGTYGVTESDLHSMLGEGFHTAFRKAVDSPVAVVIHKLIQEMDGEDWRAIIDFVAEPIIEQLRRAEEESKGKEVKT